MKDAEQLRLVERIQAGDAAAEQELFRRYRDAIHWKVCRSIDARVEDLKDVVSEIYLAILEGLRKKEFQPERWESLEAYIWGVTNNKIKDWFKRQKTEKKYRDGYLPADELVAATNEYLAENDELQRRLRTLIKGLAPKYKKVLDLRYFQELSVAEISARLRLPPRRVSERIHYALKLLRKNWKKQKIVNISH